MSTMAPEKTYSSILASVIQPDNGKLSPAIANEFLKWTFDPKDYERMAILSAKAREGSLSPEERSEIDRYGLIGTFLDIIQSKSRRALKLATEQ